MINIMTEKAFKELIIGNMIRNVYGDERCKNLAKLFEDEHHNIEKLDKSAREIITYVKGMLKHKFDVVPSKN